MIEFLIDGVEESTYDYLAEIEEGSSEASTDTEEE